MSSTVLPSVKKPVWSPVILTLLMAFATFFTSGIINQFKQAFSIESFLLSVPLWLTYLTLFFVMLRTGKVNKIRSILFFTAAVTFTFSFVLDLYEQRHHFMFVTFEDAATGAVPFCHIAITQSLFSLPVNKTFSFPGTIHSFDSGYGMMGMVISWLGVSLIIGRGWCSWFCFFGGWEDGISQLARKKRIKKLPGKAFYIPYVVLLVTAFLSLIRLSPFYCEWLCPFKASSEMFEITSGLVIIQTVIFAVLFIGLVLALPFLSKKRTQCSFLCPFGAMQSIVDKITPFNVRIDTTVCIRCGKCIAVCPMSSIKKENLDSGKVGLHCVKCGKCMDVCPQNAISYHIKGTPVSAAWFNIARKVFLFCGFFLLTLMSFGFVSESLERILSLLKTGSLFAI